MSSVIQVMLATEKQHFVPEQRTFDGGKNLWLKIS
jgi:hypothetical protein